MSDIMEQIVGRIDDEYVHGGSDAAVRLDDGSYLVDGAMAIDEVERAHWLRARGGRRMRDDRRACCCRCSTASPKRATP